MKTVGVVILILLLVLIVGEFVYIAVSRTRRWRQYAEDQAARDRADSKKPRVGDLVYCVDCRSHQLVRYGLFVDHNRKQPSVPFDMADEPCPASSTRPVGWQ